MLPKGLKNYTKFAPIFLNMLAVGLTILPCAWLTDQPMPQAIFAMAGRFFATYAMNTGFQFSVEVI